MAVNPWLRVFAPFAAGYSSTCRATSTRSSRRIEAALPVVTALGSAAFALTTNLAELAFARGLIGLGVSACLMASFKAFSLWFPAERQGRGNTALNLCTFAGAFGLQRGFGALVDTLHEGGRRSAMRISGPSVCC